MGYVQAHNRATGKHGGKGMTVVQQQGLISGWLALE
jgi:hypothetical protein